MFLQGALSLEALISDSSNLPLKSVPYIHYPVWFKKDQTKVQTLLDSDIELNGMTSAYMAKLGLKILLSNVGI